MYNLDHIGFASEMFGDGLNPCAKCDFDCLDNMKHVQCVVCDHYYHKECTDLRPLIIDFEVLVRAGIFCLIKIKYRSTGKSFHSPTDGIAVL